MLGCSKEVKSVLHIFACTQDKLYLRFLMSIVVCFHSHKYSSCKSIRENRNRFFSKKWIQVSWQPSNDMCGQEPVSTKRSQNSSKWFNTSKKLLNWKNLNSTLSFKLYLSVRLWEMKRVPGLSSNQYYELCLKTGTCSINEVFLLCMRVSQFQTLLRSRDSPRNVQSWKMLGGKCTWHKKDRKDSSVYKVYCNFEDNYIFVGNFDTSYRSYQHTPWNCNNKIYGVEGSRDQGPRSRKSNTLFLSNV